MYDFPILSITWLLPIAGALLITMLPRTQEGMIRAVAAACTLGSLVLSLMVCFGYDPETGECK